ncbi:MAG: peptidase prolyl oligopeptidase domain protein beta-propeller [Bacteroidetes bacterium]|nr:peptidase prolyl oligopeptidase domain protein beta-propeller [Bacteroidota bacterium]
MPFMLPRLFLANNHILAVNQPTVVMKKILSPLFLFPMISMAQMQYPVTSTVAQVDTYHGTLVSDPYRWLEDDHSAKTKEWIGEQNKLTYAYLEKIPFRKQMRERLEKVYDYPKYSSPFRNHSYYYFYKNDGLQNQSVLYRQQGLNGKPELVIDPNKLAADGTTRMTDFSLSKDGTHAAYAVSKGGSDWTEVYEMDMKTLATMPDHLEWVKVSGLSWQGDGFYYSRYPTPEKTLSSKNENHQVYFHTVGTSQDRDQLIFEDKQHPERFHHVSTSDDEKYSFLFVSDRGKGLDGNALYYKKKGDKAFTPIVSKITDYHYSVVDVDTAAHAFVISTNEHAPNYKVVTKSALPEWKSTGFTTIIPEQKEPIEHVSSAGGKLFVSYLKDVTSKVYLYNMKGVKENEVILPGLGTVGGFDGESDDKDVFYVFNSFTYAPTIFQYSIATQKTAVFRKPEVAFDVSLFDTKQVFYKSKDGTSVPMFIVFKKGIVQNGSNPTLLYGYGGFNINKTPEFDPLLIPFLEAGGIFVSANIRGGGEYGEAWHEQGMKLKKQNVFDDFIAAAEYLIREKYTDKDHLAIKGRSNGGLLIGAVLNQRPDLFKVAIPQVGVMDMLRFQKFTIGWNWIADYGTSDSAADFRSLYKFSPLHNINSKAVYPATLVTTSDHDDRVVPAHSFKYISTLQALAGKNTKAPLLIRVDTNSGHGASNTRKTIEITADIYSFIFYNMGITPKL